MRTPCNEPGGRRASNGSPLGGAVRVCQPFGEQLRGNFRCRTVEGHRCGGDAGYANEVRPPAISRDSRDFDVVGAAFDGFGDVLHVNPARE